MNHGHALAPEIPVAQLDVDARAAFVGRTYSHLFGAIVAFTLLEIFLFQSGIAESITEVVMGVSWLLVLGGFMVAGWLFSRIAHQARSLPAQYLGLGGYVIAQAIIFTPLLWIADTYAGGGIISNAAVVTLAGFGVLTAIAFTTRKDFSFLKSVLIWGGFAALGLIVASLLFSFALGPIFCVGMIALAGAAILYDTSRVLRDFPEDRYVAASLELFASVALMFWYVLQLFLHFSDD